MHLPSMEKQQSLEQCLLPVGGWPQYSLTWFGRRRWRSSKSSRMPTSSSMAWRSGGKRKRWSRSDNSEREEEEEEEERKEEDGSASSDTRRDPTAKGVLEEEGGAISRITTKEELGRCHFKRYSLMRCEAVWKKGRLCSFSSQAKRTSKGEFDGVPTRNVTNSKDKQSSNTLQKETISQNEKKQSLKERISQLTFQCGFQCFQGLDEKQDNGAQENGRVQEQPFRGQERVDEGQNTARQALFWILEGQEYEGWSGSRCRFEDPLGSMMNSSLRNRAKNERGGKKGREIER